MVIIPHPNNNDVTKLIGKKALTFDQIKQMPTDRLLAYFKKHRRLSGIGRCDCCGELLTDKDQINNAIATEYLSQIKQELNNRPHSTKAHKNRKLK